jgi:hypothetical protein
MSTANNIINPSTSNPPSPVVVRTDETRTSEVRSSPLTVRHVGSPPAYDSLSAVGQGTQIPNVCASPTQVNSASSTVLELKQTEGREPVFYICFGYSIKNYFLFFLFLLSIKIPFFFDFEVDISHKLLILFDLCDCILGSRI